MFGEARQDIGTNSVRGIVNADHSAAWSCYTWVSNFISVHANTDPNHISNKRYHINSPRDVPGMAGSGATASVTHHGGAASSAHAGGAHFCMGDGAVKFLNETIDHSLYAQLNYCTDGLPTPEF